MNIFSGVDPSIGEFEACLTQNDIASALGTGIEQLLFHLYSRRAPAYKTFTIPKASGEDRLIAAPPPLLMSWQKIVSEYLSKRYIRKPSIHGFVEGYSICTNAKEHVGRHLVLNIDIRDFFPSIHYGRVRGMFSRHPFNFPHEVASTLARLCTWHGALPQGAPTSPVISNLICRGMDNDIWRLLRKSSCKYTRYADDITISTNRQSFPEQIVISHDAISGVVQLGDALQGIVSRHKFAVNDRKVRVQTSAHRQSVTGLTVNERVNVKRKYIQTLRAILCDWRVNGEPSAEEKFRSLDVTRRVRAVSTPRLCHHVAGKLEFLKMVRGEGDPVYSKYAIDASRLSRDIPVLPVICGRSAEILRFMRETLWTVLAYDASGFAIPMGTAFTLADGGIVSARHVFDDTDGESYSWKLMRACSPYDEFPIHSYRNEPGVDMTLLLSGANSHAGLQMTFP